MVWTDIARCELCKARKVKCDRAEPSCGWCAKNNRVCIYQERKKPGLRIAYVHELEDKINRLEAVLHSLGRRVEDHILEHESYSKTSNQSSTGMPIGATPRSDGQLPAFSDVASQSSLTVETQFPSYTRDHAPRSESMALPSVLNGSAITATPTSAGANMSSTEKRPFLSRPRAATTTTISDILPLTSESELPPYDLVYSLVDLFFKHVNPWCPILERKTTFDALFGGARLTDEARVLLHAIVATTIRFSKDPRLTPESRANYHDVSQSKVLLYGMQHPGVVALEALVILSIDLLGFSNTRQGENLLALLSRNIVQLGLGVERNVYLGQPMYNTISTIPESSASKPRVWIDDEGRRRVVWMVYILDRYQTVSNCSSFVFSDSDMDRRLPTTYDLFSKNQPVQTRWPRIAHHPETSPDKPENLGSFSYHCEVLTILSRVHNFLKRPVDIDSLNDFQQWRSMYQDLDSELNTWLHSLPGEYGKISQLCHSDPGSKISNWIMLHAAFVTAVIRLHSVAAYPTIRSQIFTPSYNAMQRCLGAVESLREIAQDTISNSMLDLLGPPFAFSLWTSARLLLVHAATMDCEIDPKIRFFMSTLHQMGQYWQIAYTYAEILNRVVEEGQQSAHNFAGNNIANSSTARNFKEMRKSAYETSQLLAQRSTDASEPTIVKEPIANELEYLEVFDFFNYPLTAIPVIDQATGTTQIQPGSSALQSPNFTMPTRESDWLSFQPPHE